MTFFRWLLITVAIIYRLEKPVNGQDESSLERKLSYLTSNATDLIDKVLTAYKTEVIDSRNFDGRIKINDVNTTFDFVVWPLTLTGLVCVKDGMFRNVLTARQTAPPTAEQFALTNGTGSVIIGAHIGLDYFHMSFDYVEASLSFLKVNGSADVSVSKNSVFIEVVVKLNPCSVKLTKFRIEELSDLDVKMRGFNDFNVFSEILGKEILKHVPEISKENYDKYFLLFIEEAISNADICQMLADV